ncbi:hypothetical protein J6590_096023, partial [Homalodisca vitripennis]
VNADQYHSEDVNDVSKGGLLLHALSAADKKKAPDEIIIWHSTALSDTTGNLLYIIAFPLGWLTTTCYLSASPVLGTLCRVARPRESLRECLLLGCCGGTVLSSPVLDTYTIAISRLSGTLVGLLQPLLSRLESERAILCLRESMDISLHREWVSILMLTAIVAKLEASLRALLNPVSAALTWVDLGFKPKKQATLHVRQANPIYGTPLQVLEDGDTYDHFSVSTLIKADQA